MEKRDSEQKEQKNTKSRELWLDESTIKEVSNEDVDHDDSKQENTNKDTNERLHRS